MKIGKLGVWTSTGKMSAAQAAAFANRVERWGYGTLWLGEVPGGRDVFVHSSFLLANTRDLNLATGIANLYSREAITAAGAQMALAEQSGGRFLLGLGVSHSLIVDGLLTQKYEKPVETMRRYLEIMNRVSYTSPQPSEKPKTVIAALGPKMLEISAQYADGAHPYNVTPEHTAAARNILGEGKLLCPEQMVLLEKDPSTARAISRRVLSIYLGLPNYLNNWKRWGFDDADLSNGGSDRFIDSMVVWGDEAAIRLRIQQHWDAGADHVCIQSIPREGMSLLPSDEKIFELLAPQQ